MRKLVVGVVLVVTALVIAGAAATMFGTSQANNDDQGESAQAAAVPSSVDDGQTPSNTVEILKGNAQAEGEDDKDDDTNVVETKPHVGLVVGTLSEPEADERGIDGGVLVIRVVEGGPSDGLIEQDDVITSVNGQEVVSAVELVEIVQGLEPNTTVTFTVVRGGESMNVDVTVGEREIRIIKRSFGFDQPMIPNELMELMEGGFSSFVRAEVVVEAEDGTFKTIRAVTGTVQDGSVNVDDGTFILDPRDGSGSVDYTINDDTRVFIGQAGSIDGLNSDDRTLVVDVIDANGDSEVMMVVQGEFLNMIDKFRGHGFPGAGIAPFERRIAPGVQPFRRFEFEGAPEIRERFRFIVPGELDEFEKGHFEFDFDGTMPDLEELFKDLPFDPHHFEIPDDFDTDESVPGDSA